MGIIKQMTIRFNLDNESDRIAWEYLQSVNESRNKTVIEIIRRTAENEKPIPEIIRETIADCLSGIVVSKEPQNESDNDINEDENQLLDIMESFMA